MVPLLSYYILNNKTLNIDYEDEGIIYKLDLNDIHIDDVTGWTVKEAEFIQGGLIRFLFSGININMQVNGSLDITRFIDLEAATLNITNLTVQVDVGTTEEVD